MRRSELAVLVLVEPEDHLRTFDQDRPLDQVRLLHHQIDGFLLRTRQRPLLPHRAARAHEVEKSLLVDVLLEEFTAGRILVDVDLLDSNVVRVQETPGVPASSSGRLCVEGELRHGRYCSAPQRRLEVGKARGSKPLQLEDPVLTVNEIFHSIQGESTHAGRPCVFVRLTACDLRCSWCDTPYAFHEGSRMSVDEVV